MSRLKYGIPRPVDPGSHGAYSVGQTSGVIAAGLAADSEVFQFRWANSGVNAVIQSITVSAAVSTTYFAAGVPLRLALYRVSAWTAAGTGGTALTPAALGKKRSSFASTVLASGDCRIASTGALGAGTKTIEGSAMHQISAGAPITSSLSGQVFLANTSMLPINIGEGDYPLVLSAQASAYEGFVITAPETPGTGTWKLVVNVQWTETSSYP